MSIFYVGQQVGCLMFGEGLVDSIANGSRYPVIVLFKNGIGLRNFRQSDGLYLEDARYTLYPIEQYRAIIANMPAPQPEKWQPKKGDWCWFWDNNYQFAVLAQFSSYDAVSSYRYQTNDGTSYQHCAPFTGELPEHLKVKEDER